MAGIPPRSSTGPSPQQRFGAYLGGQDVHAQEAERVLTHVAAARNRAEQARRTLARAGADPALLDAIARAEQLLLDAQRRLVGILDRGAGSR